jgi:hypothetical protein
LQLSVLVLGSAWRSDDGSRISRFIELVDWKNEPGVGLRTSHRTALNFTVLPT